MLLTIDVGNTNTVFGGFFGNELRFVSRIATVKGLTEDEYAVKIRSILELYNVHDTSISGAIISSVVPALTPVLKKAVKTVYNTDALIVGPGIKTGINLLVDNPAQVGADLICASVSAFDKYHKSCVVLDLGTATKIMAINNDGAFLGVSIIPGVELAMNALASNTALLPQIAIEAPKHIIGKNTIECMHSGIIYGNACMIDGMLSRIRTELGFSDMTCIATGGLAGFIIPHCKHKIEQDPHLLLKGLKILYEKNK